MQLTEQCFDNALVLKVSGRIDRDTAGEFKAALAPHLEKCRLGGYALLLDFSEVQYLSSMGFQELLLAQRRARLQNGSFGVAAFQPTVKSVFDVANFAGVIRCHENVEQALAVMSHSVHAAYMQGR